LNVVVHPDPIVLERALLARLADEHRPDRFTRTLIVVPTRRLVDHLQRRLAEAREAWLGVEIVHLPGLPRRILETQGAAPRVGSTHVRRALLRRLLEQKPDNAWAQFVRARPGGLRRLASAIQDLREAGVEPKMLDSCCATPPDRALAQLYRGYVAELGRLARNNWVDEAGSARAALAAVEPFAQGFDTILVHGAYEVLGIYLDLLNALNAHVPITTFVPCRPGTTLSAFSERFMRDWLLDGEEPQQLPDATDDRPALDALYDEAARPEPAPEGRFLFAHGRGALAEIKWSLRQALAAVDAGCPPSEIAIVARSLTPYATAIAEAFDDDPVPWTSSLRMPLRREPLVRDFLLLLRVIEEDFPRRAAVELLDSPRISWTSLFPGAAPPPVGSMDLWSRKARLLGGLDEWSQALPAWAGQSHVRSDATDEERERADRQAREREREARGTVELLRRLTDRLRPDEKRGWSEHAQRVESVLDSLFGDPDEARAVAAVAALREILTELAELEFVLGDERAVSFGALRIVLEQAVDESETTPRRADDGGIRVLDAMQARGLTFRHLFLVGVNAGGFPGPPREDPILHDELREKLRERAKRPVPIKSEGSHEERTLLGLMLGAASESTHVSWQRADEAGKSKTPSLALREVARIALGSPRIDELVATARHLRSHPLQWLQTLADEAGLISPSEERLLSALAGTGQTHLSELSDRFGEMARGLRMLQATQSFTAVDGSYDARLDGLPPLEQISVSDLEGLGRCPLQFFFGKVLRVSEVEEEVSLFGVSSRDLGSQVHNALDRLYSTLAAEGHLDGPVEEAQRRARAWLDQHRDSLIGELVQRIGQRIPVLSRQLKRNWNAAVVRFVDHDLRRIIEEKWKLVDLEETVTRDIDFGDGRKLRIRGRFDRRLGLDERILVGDYKTSGNLTHRRDAKEMLRGQTLQVPLYAMLAGEKAEVQLLGVGPDFDPAEEVATPAFSGFGKENQTAGFRETLRELIDLRSRACFPIRKHDKVCGWCAYREACRATHPPTEERELHSRDGELLRLLQAKSTKAPQLIDLPPRRYNGDA